MKDSSSSAPAGRAMYATLAACIVGIVLYCSLALPSYGVPSFELPAWTSKITSDPGLLFRSSPSSSGSLELLASTSCAASPTLLAEYGQHNLRMAQVHVGSGYRVQKVLQKAARGERVRVGVLGGSVSLGHGTDPKTGHRNKYGAVPHEAQWHQLVLAHLEQTFPQADIDGEDLDLIAVEMAVNDEFSNGMDSVENLLRSLLNLDSEPAVLFVDFFALQSGSAQKTILSGQDVQNSLASWYDVPQISARPALLQAMIRDPALAEPLFLGDLRHGTQVVHRFVGNMVVGYLQEEQCRAERLGLEEHDDGRDEDVAKAWLGRDGLGKVPSVKLNEGWDTKIEHPTKPPTCGVAGAGLEPVEPSPDWQLFNWKYSKYFWETTVPSSSTIAFAAVVREGAQGLLAVSYLRSRQYDLGKARCSVEGQEVTLDGSWQRSTSVAQTAIVARGLAPGRHEVRCRTLPRAKEGGGTAFRLMGVMTL
ncbi:uncharacterized protein RHOBADRAFT_40851 [Rhodotorula graminis WP1]|uniref:Uncharacterized protein n=1 Tax=Rhodotorula graminis (strain WP1) TaxID=578459 RepID=A0A194SCH3_RHOGW|nr:uncharacterized protein RHOBADRAFT_40851 [Rhodotorula graminis WP1]KPV78304.1 hypothetical protein RHOBADRAFT_40851 [Rhodotorula graminis WP1]